jgi:Holliday junction resolvase
MAMTPEKKVKQQVVKVLKYYGAYCFYPVTAGFGASGVPDIVACYKGRFIGIECKAGKNKPTDLQKRNLDAISECGGIALVINEDSVADLVSALSEM